MKSIIYFKTLIKITLYLYLIAIFGLNQCECHKPPKSLDFFKMSKLYHTVLLCENLSPESVTMETVCLSPCAITNMDESLKCNRQAETWKIRLTVDKSSTYFDTTGCKQGMRRFKCFPYKSNEGECDDESALVYPKGYSCFTKCGVKTCPSDSFKMPKDPEDLKVADCTSGFRTRCSFNEAEETKEIGTGNLTLEIKTKSSET